MVDTLVLGTSAQAWEFESLHAQIFRAFGLFFYAYIKVLLSLNIVTKMSPVNDFFFYAYIKVLLSLNIVTKMSPVNDFFTE